MGLLRSRKHCSFAFLWAGQTISRLGDSLCRIELAWWVLDGPIAVLLPFLGKDALGGDVGALDLLYSVSSLGVIVRGIAVLAAGLAIAVVGICIAMFVEGLSVATFGLIWTNTL